MKPKNQNYQHRVKEIFSQAHFMNELGVELTKIEPGICWTQLQVQTKHLQQDQFVHAGVLATMADHTAGGCAGTLMAEGEYVLTVEFKINFLRPAVGDTIVCEAKVLKPGKQLCIVESEVFVKHTNQQKLCAKAMVTLTYLPQN